MSGSPLFGPTRKSVGCDEGRFIFPEESRLRTVGGEAPLNWSKLLRVLIALLTALAGALGVVSCAK